MQHNSSHHKWRVRWATSGSHLDFEALKCIGNTKSKCVQVWVAAVQASKDQGITAGAVAAAAMFVLVVTRTNDEWASWSEHDNMFVR